MPQSIASTFLDVMRGTGRQVLVSIDLTTGAVAGAVPVPIGEVDKIGFSIRNPMPELEYRILLGDVPVRNPSSGDDDFDPELGRVWGDRVEWETRVHFESCRGKTPIRLEHRKSDSSDPWLGLCEIDAAVVPTKLSERRYESMFMQLSALAARLVFDVVSRSRLAIGSKSESRLRLRPSLSAEVQLLRSWWAAYEDAIRALEQSPARATSRICAHRPCWGHERLTHRSLRMIATRAGGTALLSVPFKGHAMMPAEVPRVWEHRVILGILDKFSDRLESCRREVDAEAAFIEGERRFRDVRPAAESLSLYQSEDTPRLRRLQRLGATLHRLELAVEHVRRSSVFDGLGSLRHEPDSPVFLNQGPYRQIRTTYFAMRAAADRLVRFGVEERVKDTSKMYEHWVFIQLALALRLAGMQCREVDTLLLRTKYTRGLRIDRRTRLVFDAPDGRSLALRYEPWISNATDARGRGDSLYRADNRMTSLCPDVVLEVFDAPGPLSASRTSYAVVLDSKYKARVREEDLDGVIGKYTTLRACHDDSQVVKQVWVVAPLGREGVFPREASVQWSPSGPSRPRTESVHGTIGALPPEHLPPDSDALLSDCIAPPIQLFASALLRYLNLVD